MKMSLIWPRDCEGYRIEPAKPIPKERRTVASGDEVPATVVGISGRERPYNAFDIDGLYHRLADWPATAEGAKSFADRYGLLRKGRRQSVEDFLGTSKSLGRLLAKKEAGDWPAIVDWFNQNHKVMRLTAAPDAHAPPELFFKPAALIDAIYLQFFMDISSGANLRRCKRPGCGNWFKYGPGTGHRETAEYCSPKCQKAHAYSKSKESKQ